MLGSEVFGNEDLKTIQLVILGKGSSISLHCSGFPLMGCCLRHSKPLMEDDSTHCGNLPFSSNLAWLSSKIFGIWVLAHCFCLQCLSAPHLPLTSIMLNKAWMWVRNWHNQINIKLVFLLSLTRMNSHFDVCCFYAFFCLLNTEGQPVWSRCRSKPVEILWDAWNCENPQGWIPRPQNLYGFLQQVSKTPNEEVVDRGAVNQPVTTSSINKQLFLLLLVCVSAGTKWSWRAKSTQIMRSRAAQTFSQFTTRPSRSGSWGRQRWSTYTDSHTVHAPTCFCHLGVT